MAPATTDTDRDNRVKVASAISIIESAKRVLDASPLTGDSGKRVSAVSSSLGSSAEELYAVTYR